MRRKSQLGPALLTMVLVMLVLSVPVARAQGSGRIEGEVKRTDGGPVGGVAVVLQGVGRATITNNRGSYVFEDVPAGTYHLSFTLGPQSTTEDVEVTAGQTTEVSTVVDWKVSFIETITVFSASRQTERITEAPAAITLIPEEEIERESANGQIPKLLEFTPGAEVTQSGLYDFNFNTRGFNSSLNRRILTLIDGRDPSVPFLGSQEWGAVSFPVDDLSSVELVRGPGSALYGADAFNGVLNMVTKAPRYSRGGEFQLTGGNLDTQRLDLRWATDLGNDWYFKLTGGWMESDDFAVSRDPGSGGPEYAGLEPELVPLFTTRDKLTFGGVRFDKYFGGKVLTVEGGTAEIEGPLAVTGIGRVQLLDVSRPWARLNFNTTHFNFLAYSNTRDASDQRSLRSGGLLVLDTDNIVGELQANTNFAGGDGRIIGGAYYKEENIDSAAPSGVQTLMFEPRSEDFEGAFAQIDYDFTDKFKGVFAARVDDSSLHDTQFSPRVSLVYALSSDHTLRASYGEAFQVPNYSEFFLRVDVAPPITALAPIEGICALGGVSCGFDQPVRILATGNPNLDVEKVQTFELGYSGVINRKAYLTLDLYRNDYDNFITDLITRFQPELGGLFNDLFPPYQPPAGLPAPLAATLLGTLQGALGPQFVFLSNDPLTGAPILVPVSYINFGQAEASGAEVGLNYYISDDWVFDLAYAYFDFDVAQQLPADPVLPNTAKNKYSLGISYLGRTFDASLKYRHTDGFDWNAGVFRGPVPGYEVTSLSANYRFTDNWMVGIDVSNVFNDQDYQSFGGDLVGRRALARIRYSW
jgi:outer membrane receptor for ferrienterochelin and colicins